MAALLFPPALKPHNVLWHSGNTSVSGGVSLTGSEQVVASVAGRWTATVELRAFGTGEDTREEAVLQLRAFLSRMRGRAGEVLLPVGDAYRPRDAQGRMFDDVQQVPLDGLFMFEHWGFGQDELLHAQLAANAALGATQISVAVLDGEGPRPGHYFGIGERLYICDEVWRDIPSGPVSVRFFPRLRAAAASGTRVILDAPVGTMRFAADDTGKTMYEMRTWGETTLDFVEAF